MGMVLGRITVETPKHEVLHAGDGYEVRKYPPCVAAEFTYDPKQWNGNADGGFTVLANYIGALGKPQNTKPEKIAMTAPVITSGGGGGEAPSEKIAMTAPVITAADGRAGGDPRGAGEEVRGGEVQRGGRGQDGAGEGGRAQGRAGEGRLHHQGPLRAREVQPAVHAPAAAHQRGHDPRRVTRPTAPGYRPAAGQ